MEVRVYTKNNSKTSARIVQYYHKQNIRCSLHWINDLEVSRKFIVGLLYKTQNGFEDLLAKQSHAYKRIRHNIDDMKTSELIKYIQDNPSVLRTPIIDDGDVVYTGIRNLGA